MANIKRKIIPTSCGRVLADYGDKLEELIPWIDNQGYPTISLDNKPKRVHRLIAETYLEKPKGNYQVNHIDGNKTNNKIDNLEWITQQDNIAHAFANGLMKGRPRRSVIGYNSEIGYWYPSVTSTPNGGNVSQVCLGKKDSYLGLKWEYCYGLD